ncbi:hypothetical protein [Streptomyces melanogenes]|uniref:hypothetical protein n=1 Tax=Streptomyces melanogenes TaxID=67326 RepID=UPI003796B4A6
MATRIRALSRRTHATAQAHLRGEDAHTFVREAHRRLGAAQSAPAAHPVELAVPGQGAVVVGETVFALRELLATGQAPEPWMDHIPAPDGDDEDQQHLWKRLTHHISTWRERRHHTGTDPLGPRPSDAAATEWQHLSEALNHYRHARITQRLATVQHPHAPTPRAPLPPAPTTPPTSSRSPAPGALWRPGCPFSGAGWLMARTRRSTSGPGRDTSGVPVAYLVVHALCRGSARHAYSRAPRRPRFGVAGDAVSA